MGLRVGLLHGVTLAGLALGALAAGLGGCRRAPPPEPSGETTLVVFAASSLREAFGALEDAFERDHPGVDVSVAYAGSQELRTQIEQGAPADVFAAADWTQMRALSQRALTVEPALFAHNELVLAVTAEASNRVHGLAELPRAERIFLGSLEVPLGRYTGDLLLRAAALYGPDFRSRVEARVVSRERSARQALQRLLLGEGDAGVVYESDARAVGAGLTLVSLPRELATRADYPIARLAHAPHPDLARAWVEFVTSPEGKSRLEAAGFRPAGAMP